MDTTARLSALFDRQPAGAFNKRGPLIVLQLIVHRKRSFALAPRAASGPDLPDEFGGIAIGGARRYARSSP